MPDTSQQDPTTPSETPVSEGNLVSPDTTESIPPTDSRPSDLPSEASESPTSVVDTPSVNDYPQPITSKEIEIVENLCIT